MWELAFTEAGKTSFIVEIPLAFIKLHSIVMPECLEKYQETNDPRYLLTITRLIVETNENGHTRGFFMTVAPSLDYLYQTDFSPFDNSYFNRDKEFDGIIVFKHINGQYANGWRYESGDIVSQLQYQKHCGTEKSGSVITCQWEGEYLYIDYYCPNSGDIATYFAGVDWVEYICWIEGGDMDDHYDDSGEGGYFPNALFFVSLSNSSHIHGNVTGGGTYLYGDWAFIAANANPGGYQFSHWVGNLPFSQYSNTGVIEDIDNHYWATAYWLMPCFSGNLSSPLVHLALAPSGGWNIAGALFNSLRKDEKGDTASIHKGIDFVGAVGDPIYSMFGGTVTTDMGLGYVDGQPNRVNRNYPSGYTGDRNEAGNRLWIRSEVNGAIFYFGYFHLQADNPIAINPDTGSPFMPGDEVSQGQIIGYMGYTGNARANNVHLHLEVRNASGVPVDPAAFINGTINATTTTVSTPCD